MPGPPGAMQQVVGFSCHLGPLWERGLPWGSLGSFLVGVREKALPCAFSGGLSGKGVGDGEGRADDSALRLPPGLRSS